MSETTTAWQGASPWLFLVGLLVFLGSLVVFLWDLLMGNDVLYSIAVNSIGSAFLIAWAALDTLSDPESEVGTRGGAAGTALLLYGLYLLLAGVVISATGLLFHDRPALGLWYLPLALVSVIVGFLTFPTETVVDDPDDTGEQATADTDSEQATADTDSERSDETDNTGP